MFWLCRWSQNILNTHLSNVRKLKYIVYTYIILNFIVFAGCPGNGSVPAFNGTTPSGQEGENCAFRDGDSVLNYLKQEKVPLILSALKGSATPTFYNAWLSSDLSVLFVNYKCWLEPSPINQVLRIITNTEATNVDFWCTTIITCTSYTLKI